MKNQVLSVTKKLMMPVLALGVIAHIHTAHEDDGHGSAKSFNFAKDQPLIISLKAQDSNTRKHILRRAIERRNVSHACIAFLALDLSGHTIAQLYPSLWLLETVAKHIPTYCRAERKKIIELYQTHLKTINTQLRQKKSIEITLQTEKTDLAIKQELYTSRVQKCNAKIKILLEQPKNRADKETEIALVKSIKMASKKALNATAQHIRDIDVSVKGLRESQNTLQKILRKIKSFKDEVFKKERAIIKDLGLIDYKHLRYRKLNSDVYSSGNIPLAICLDESKNIIVKEDLYGVVQEYKIKKTFLEETISWMINTNAVVIATRALSDLLLHVLSTPEAELTTDIRLLKIHINAQTWSCFYCDEADFVVWIPKAHENEYRAAFKPWVLDQVLLDNTDKMIEYTKRSYHTKKEDRPADLIRLFNDQNCRQTLNIFLSGHGNSTGSMAGMYIDATKPESQRITSFLSFLSKKMKIGTLCLSSCKAGGANKKLLQYNADFKMRLQYNYRLILASNTDKPVSIEPVHVVPNFFKNAALKASSKKIAYDLHYQKQGNNDIHGCAAFPLVLEAKSNEFTYLRSPDGEETLLARPITTSVWQNKIKGKQLLFSTNGTELMPLVIRPYQVDSLALLEKKIPESILRHMPIYWTSNLKKIEYSELYPEIRSLNSSDLYLHQVNLVSPSGCPQSGILQFLRDAFCDISEKYPEARTITIQELRGINDISIQMRRARRAAGETIQRTCEKVFSQTEGKRITLYDSKVQIKENSITLTITHPQTDQSFEWAVRLRKANPIAWNFGSI